VFVNLRVFTELRWGTQDPVVFRDRELGLIRLRAFGIFAMRITEPLAFVNTLVGTLGSFGAEQIHGYLRELIVSRLNDTLGECVDSLADLPSRYDTMAMTVRERLAADFRRYGAELVDLRISRITPPDEVQRMIDGRSGMAAIGDLDGYLKLRAADALADAAAGGGVDAACADSSATAPGSGAGMGAGIALGAGLGLMLPGMLLRTRGGTPLATDDMLARGLTRCPECHAEVSTQSRFCASCGHQMVVARRCMRCDKNVTVQANFCPSCGLDLRAEHRCARCSAALPPGTRFCFRCGEPTAEISKSAPPAGA
jgi:membrane protease subunit (stomatin/prohibitin family)